MSVKSLARKRQDYTDLLASDEDPFSTNKVTRWSLNVPIIGTCTPSVVCGETCYFAKGPSTWTASLKKQHRLMNAIKADPARAADMIVESAIRKKLDFIRWNGGGDLFEEMLPCIDRVAVLLPDVQQWVVSRKPALAARVTPRPNVWIHLSTDRSCMNRLDDMRQLAPPDLQWFWSYQCDKGEGTPPNEIAPVIFRDGYDPKGEPLVPNDCPLNGAESIVRMCETCRRCFNGEAVERCKSL